MHIIEEYIRRYSVHASRANNSNTRLAASFLHSHQNTKYLKGNPIVDENGKHRNKIILIT